MTMQAERSSRTSSSSDEVDSKLAAFDASNIKAIQLATGWQKVDQCEYVHFAVGQSHSPISPTELRPALRYVNQQGQAIYTPISQILSFSKDPVAQR